MEKLPFGKEINLNGEIKYNIEKIISECEDKENEPFVSYVSMVLKEERKDLIGEIYKEIGKDFIIHILKKTLEIENNGGMQKGGGAQGRKTTGGIFFFQIKISDLAPRDVIKKVFKINYKQRNERKKVYRKLQKLLI